MGKMDLRSGKWAAFSAAAAAAAPVAILKAQRSPDARILQLGFGSSELTHERPVTVAPRAGHSKRFP